MSEVRQNTETLKYIFDEQKAAEASSCLLSANGGCLPYMKLIKLLYIADRRSLTMYHSSITTDSYFSMKFGPVPTSILDCIKHADEYPSDSPWNSSIKTRGYDVILKKTFSQRFLSQEERDLLETVNSEYKGKDQFDLSDITHAFPEWYNPGDSRIPLPIEDILQATISDDNKREEAASDIRMSAYIHNLSFSQR